MTPETFFKHFETFAEAPKGITKLRELILQLAVQGKLGTQDDNDEPSSDLLQRIEKEKDRLITLGKLRSPSRLPPVKEREIPHRWAIVRLGSLIELVSGQHLTPEEYNEIGEGYPYLTGPADFEERHPIATRWTHADRALARRDDILITVKGAGIGKLNIVATDTAFISRQLMAVRPIVVDRDFVYLTLQSGYESFQRQGVGIAIPGIGREDILHFVIAVPPLAEQRRIVEKVDQLLGLCDELAARQAARREARSALVGATLDRLVSSSQTQSISSSSPQYSGERGSGGEGLNHSKRMPNHPQPLSPKYSGDASKAKDLARLRNHFDQLFDTPKTIPQLRQAILQLAVQGRLVTQDPNEEPASELISKIIAERRRFVEQRNSSDFASNTKSPNEVLRYSLPRGWEWIRFGELGGFLGGGTPSKDRAEYWDGTIPWVSPKDMKRPYMNDAIDHVSALGIANSSTKMIPVGSLLMVVRGMILVHSFPVALTTRELTINQDMKALQLALPELGEYLLKFCAAFKTRILACVERSSHGTCRLPTEALANFPVPVPPLSEQKRIVSRVTELLSLCDALEANLTQAEIASTQLLSSAINHLLNGQRSP